MSAPSATDEAHGDMWTSLLGDSCERLGELADNSVDLSLYSPPFASLYTYSPSERDIGNCANWDEFFIHYGFVIRELLRATKPGRNSFVHAADTATTKATHGVTGLRDLTGAVIKAHVDAGWVFYGRWFIDKCPQAAAIRTKAQHLMFVTKNRDSAKSAPATPDQGLLFKKPGDNAVPIPHEADEPPPGVSNEDWISWARPCWLGIRETHTLSAREAREQADERHLHALQLDFIERGVRLWTNPGELVVSPFAGIGSEGWMARKLGRRAWSCELKPTYWAQQVRNMRTLDEDMGAASLFDLDEVAS
ncbi:MAG: site-specific DNA-methyltransferase [Actinomycetota bacterium]|nr:site-specific DNA-methyltransferase [Actinomycetota bacterium]